jgi:hypothetical protein
VNRILSTCVSVLVIWQVILQAEEFNATDLGNNWYQHEQFGTFYDANNSDWYYHLDHGWIYVDEWDDNGTWMYVPLADDNSTIETNSSLSQDVALGWMWSKAEHYPQLYNNELEDWLYFNKERNQSKYYCHQLKKYLAEDILTKLSVSEDDWESLAPFFFIDENESWEGEDLLPNLDTAYAGVWNIKIPKSEVLANSNWSSVIQTILTDELEAKKRGVKRSWEDSDSYYIKFRPLKTVTVSLSAIEFPNSSEVVLRSNDGSLGFSFDSNITLGTVNFFNNVKHLSIKDGALTESDFDISKGNGQISFKTAHPRFIIRARQNHSE